MITSLLVVTFCTLSTCEEYAIDHNLTKQDCIERKYEEINDSKNESLNQVYLDAVERYQAVPMQGEILSVGFKCVKG